MSNLTELRHGIDLGVINREMLEKSLAKHAPPNERGRLFAEESKNFKLVTILRLGFLNIIKIDYLWMFESLSVLTLTHNKIEKIENLSELINLKELDVSFNEITKIENLNRLTNLEVLLLNDNKISILENLDCLQKLIVLSISCNCINNYKQVIYLRLLRSLRSLSFKDNPCCDDSECYMFIKAVLPKMKYIDYVTVDSEERMKCASKYSIILDDLNEQDNRKKIAVKNKEENDSKIKFNHDCFIEEANYENVLMKMFKFDEDGYILLNSIDILTEEQERYKIKFLEIMHDYEQFAHDQYYLRKNEIDLFENELNKMRIECANKSRMAILNYSNQISNQAVSKFGLENEENLQNYDKTDIKPCSIDLIDQLWEDLMSWEMEFYEQCMKMRNHFADNINKLFEDLISKIEHMYSRWREEDNNFIVYEKEIYTKMSQGQIACDKIEIEYLLSDLEILMDIITLSSEKHIQFIKDNEEALLDNINRWESNLITDINKFEVDRNRSRVLEIITFIEDQRKEILIV